MRVSKIALIRRYNQTVGTNEPGSRGAGSKNDRVQRKDQLVGAVMRQVLILFFQPSHPIAQERGKWEQWKRRMWPLVPFFAGIGPRRKVRSRLSPCVCLSGSVVSHCSLVISQQALFYCVRLRPHFLSQNKQNIDYLSALDSQFGTPHTVKPESD